MTVASLPAPAGFPGPIPLPDESRAREGEGGVIKIEPGTLIWIGDAREGERAVYKIYRRRGPLVRAGARWLGFRAAREYEALARLHAHGIPCSVPLFWCEGRHPLLGGYELLATRLVGDAVSLESVVKSSPETARALDLAFLFRHIRAMHRCGVRHGALTFRNFLVKPATGEFFIIDMARAILFPSDLSGTRMAWFDLLDFCRKIAGKWGEETCDPLLRAYGLPDDRRRALRRQLRAYRPTRHTRNRLRAEFLLRAFAARLGAGPSGRDAIAGKRDAPPAPARETP